MEFAAPVAFTEIPRPAFGSAAQHLATAPRVTTKADRRHVRAARLAADLLPELPQPGEAVHAIMTGSYDLTQVIMNVVRRLPHCRHLRIASLCYSKRNIADLCAVLAERRDAPLSLALLVSVFFKQHNRELYGKAVEDLTAYPGVTVGAARNHCKVVAFDLGPGDGLVFEGSANLRSNKNREQLAVIRDRGLHDWHAAWIDEQVRASHGEGKG